MRVLRGLQFFSVFCRRCQLSVLVTALWLSPTPSIPGGSVDERGCPVPAPSQAQLPPLGRQAPGALQGLALRPPPLLGLADAAASLSSVSLCPEPPSLRSRWARPPVARPPARPSGAWTPGRACNPRPSRGPSRAHPRPLEGAPPGPLLGVSLALLAHSPSSGCHPLVQSRDRALGLRGTHVVKLSVFKPRFPCARVTPLRVSCLLSVLPRSSFFMCAPSISSGSLRS